MQHTDYKLKNFKMALTGYRAKVEVLSDDLLELAVHRTRREAFAEIQPEIFAQC